MTADDKATLALVLSATVPVGMKLIELGIAWTKRATRGEKLRDNVIREVGGDGRETYLVRSSFTRQRKADRLEDYEREGMPAHACFYEVPGVARFEMDEPTWKQSRKDGAWLEFCDITASAETVKHLALTGIVPPPR